MREINVYGDTLPEAYHKALLQLNSLGEINDCGDWNTRCSEVGMTIKIGKPTMEPMISKLTNCGPRELEQYRMEMLDGILDFEIDKGNWKYTYHNRMVCYPNDDEIDGYTNQIEWVINELQRNPSSRRACIMIRNAEDIGSDDPSCLQHMQIQLRNGYLDLQVLFRSNDAVKACFMNMFALICLQKRIADILGVKVGAYTHRVNNFHAYMRDFDTLEYYRRQIANSDIRELTYNYKGDWDEMMEEERIDILRSVEELKKR